MFFAVPNRRNFRVVIKASSRIVQFYKLFYHREPSDQMLNALFADATHPF